MRTHYDNLKVARDAPPEVIRAAYKTLSQRYHPDRNPGDENCARIMAVLNQAYDVLSDPHKRQLHDEWILHAEERAYHAQQASPPVYKEATRSKANSLARLAKAAWLRFLAFVRKLLAALLAWAVIICALIGVVAIFNGGVDTLFEESPAPPGPKPYTSLPPLPQPAPRPAYVRPATAPNGTSWPIKAAYIKNGVFLNTAGKSTVTVDNTRNSSDVHAKLIYLGGPKAFPVREFFIPGKQKFTLASVTPGLYDVRYRDLDSGGLSRSDSFSIEEIETADGYRYSDLTMTLYKVQNGNMATFRLPENEF